MRERNLVFLTTVMVVCILQMAWGASAEPTYTFRGTILDEEGRPLQGVSILAYDRNKVDDSGHGYYLGTFTSQSDGTYKVPLYNGGFELVYQKAGYESVTRDLGFTYLFDVDLGPMTLRTTLAMSIGATERVAGPGETISVPFTITNNGGVEEHVVLSTSCRGNVTAEVRDAVGVVKAVDVATGESLELSIRLIFPSNASGAAEVTLTAQGSTTKTGTVSFEILGKPSTVSLCQSQYPSKKSSPGGSVDYDVTVTNPLATSGEAALTLTDIPEGWEATLLNKGYEQVDSVYLSSGGSDIVTVRVNVPRTASEGKYSFGLNATIGGLSGGTRLRLAVGSKVLALGMVTKYPVQLVKQGAVASFPITFENPGESPETLMLSMEFLPKNWKGTFTTGAGAEIQSVLLDPKGKDTITAVITPPYDVKPNNFGIRINAVSENLNGTLSLTVGITGNTEMSLKIGNLFSQLTVGETKEITLGVANTGFNTVTYPRLDIKPSVETFVVEYSPLDVKYIEPGATQTFTIRVTAQEGTAQGDYLIDVRALSSEVLTPVSQIRVSVQASSGQTMTVGIVIAIAFASVALVYLKFKRR